MKIVKKKNNHWICYPENRTEFDEITEWLRKKLGRSHWSVFNQTWTTRNIQTDECGPGRYYRVVEIRNRDIVALVQLTWG